MEEVLSKVAELKEAWSTIHTQAAAAENSWRPHLPYSSLEEIGEVVGTISALMGRVRAPVGFSPGFHLAKGLAATSLPSVLALAKNIERGQYNHLPAFINSLVTIVNAAYTMIIFSPAEAVQEATGSMASQLSEGLALVHSAQQELAVKHEMLMKTDELVSGIKTHAAVAQDIVEKASAQLETMEQVKSKLSALQEEAEKAFAETAKARASADELQALNQEQAKELSHLQEETKQVHQRSVSQENLIESLLPKGASAGLAAAFALRESQLNVGKWLWMGSFLVSIAALAAFAVHLTSITSVAPGEFWKNISVRLPLAAPLVWLGWFSAIQYGNIVRVQEDYAFKEATSRAFAGYRDHLEHLASINTDDAKSAMHFMSQKTIEILAREPLRIFDKSEKDASPAQSISGLFSRQQKEKQGE